MERDIGLLVALGGVAVVVVGLLIWSGALSWFGHLPGDVRHEGESTRVYVPITSMIVVSVVLTVLVNVAQRLR